VTRPLGAAGPQASACTAGSTDQARLPFLPRWGQPAQQQGRRIPSLSSVRTLSIRLRLVSGFLAPSTQQIHSLRASGVMSSQSASAALSAVRVFRKSAGTPCTTPVAISLLDIYLFCQFFRYNAQRYSKFNYNGAGDQRRVSSRACSRDLSSAVAA
jgi:hypothetical protein